MVEKDFAMRQQHFPDLSRFKRNTRQITCTIEPLSHDRAALGRTTKQALTSHHPLTTMGKRKKSSRKPGPKKRREPLGSVNCSFFTSHVLTDDLPDTTFTCLFCHHDNSVTVKLDRKEGVAQLVCKICGQSFQSKVNRTSCSTRM